MPLRRSSQPGLEDVWGQVHWRGDHRLTRAGGGRWEPSRVERGARLSGYFIIRELPEGRPPRSIRWMPFRMAILDIVLEGDPRLRQKAHRIRTVDDSIRRIASDMHETMLDAPGVGLAAPQIGLGLRLIVVHVPEDFDEEGSAATTLTLINPEIVKAQGRVLGYEGCLSIPGWTGEVPRSDRVSIKALGLDSRPIKLKHEGWVARVLQHEIDHLDGILFLDRVEDRSTIKEVPEDETDEAPGESLADTDHAVAS